MQVKNYSLAPMGAALHTQRVLSTETWGSQGWWHSVRNSKY